MSLILCIETATKVCSVCLAKDGEIIRSLAIHSEKYSHAEKLNGLIIQLFEESEFNLKNIDAIAISEGPGSYTGLRIGTSTAKGFCYAMDIPLIAINSLKALAFSKKGEKILICPMFDARRMEVYSAIFDSNMTELEETKAVIIDDLSYTHFLNQNKVCFLGPGAEKCQETIVHENAIFDLETKVSATGMAMFATEKFNKKDFVDLAYFEPFYLKDFIAGTPKKIF